MQRKLFTLDDASVAAMERLAKVYGCNRSELVRMLIETADRDIGEIDESRMQGKVSDDGLSYYIGGEDEWKRAAKIVETEGWIDDGDADKGIEVYYASHLHPYPRPESPPIKFMAVHFNLGCGFDGGVRAVDGFTISSSGRILGVDIAAIEKGCVAVLIFEMPVDMLTKVGDAEKADEYTRGLCRIYNTLPIVDGKFSCDYNYFISRTPYLWGT